MLKSLPVLLIALTSLAHAGPVEVAKAMLDSGSPGLAQAYLKAHQPPEPDPEWGKLEIRLLAKEGKDAPVLELAERLPFSAEIAHLAIRSAFRLNRPDSASDWIAKLIWEGKLSKGELRQARLDAIRARLLARDFTNAYYAMLRFDQDYKPVTRTEADVFVSGLNDANRARDALPWFTLLDDADPAKLRAELQTGLLSPDEVIASPGITPALLLDAADRKGDASLSISACEALVEAGKLDAAELWKRYLESAIPFSNRYALLQGTPWFESLAKIQDPEAQRALLAWLSKHAGVDKSRAASLLAASLDSLPKTAVALLSGMPGLDEATRRKLGGMAFRSGQYAQAVGFWQGLTLSGAENIDLAYAEIASGKPADAALGAAKAPVPQDRLIALADLAAKSAPDQLERLMPLAEPEARRTLLMMMGRTTTDPLIAAGRYFEAATLIPAKSADALAVSARIACAMSLQKAGLREDANAQYKWLLARTRDPALLRAISLIQP